ncbi:MAG: hypothetical protein K9W43_03775 [Candidatus Thorarchaeota archaeon]|nr:hypothetical protein [Candidatus Thorarchaeota archaeon]
MTPVEKFNPHKRSALSFKRDRQRGGRSGRQVAIREITIDEVRRDALEFGLATGIHMELKSGKEASVYLAMWKQYPIALKAFRLWQSSQTRKKRGFFALGKMEMLAAKEFDVLTAAFTVGVPVPTPIGRVGNYLTMRFIGDGLIPAPRLKDVELENPESVLDQILDDYLRLYRDAHYTHGDLSPFNLLWWRGKAWFIDFPQAKSVDPWADMNQIVAILRADIENVVEYFERYDLERDCDEILSTFLKSYVPENHRHFLDF